MFDTELIGIEGVDTPNEIRYVKGSATDSKDGQDTPKDKAESAVIEAAESAASSASSSVSAAAEAAASSASASAGDGIVASALSGAAEIVKTMMVDDDDGVDHQEL